MRIAPPVSHYTVRHIGNLPGKLGEHELHHFDQLPLRKLELAPHFGHPKTSLTLDDIYFHAGQPDPSGVVMGTCQLPPELTTPFTIKGIRTLQAACETTVFIPGILRFGEIITGFLVNSADLSNELMAKYSTFFSPEKTMFVSLIGPGGEVCSADELSQTIGILLGHLILNEKAVSQVLSPAEKDELALRYFLSLCHF